MKRGETPETIYYEWETGEEDLRAVFEERTEILGAAEMALELFMKKMNDLKRQHVNAWNHVREAIEKQHGIRLPDLLVYNRRSGRVELKRDPASEVDELPKPRIKDMKKTATVH